MATPVISPTPAVSRLSELRGSEWQTLEWSSVPYVLAAAWWVENFLTKSDEKLGRDGPVCPFVQPAMDRGILWMGSCGLSNDAEVEEVRSAILPYREILTSCPPLEGSDADYVYKAVLIVLPKLHCREGFELVDRAQQVLKPDFVPHGLMVGQFHPFCEEPGVRNELFRPLKCPVAMLVLRYMTRYDLPFLAAPAYFNAYKARFGDDVPERLLPLFEQALLVAETKEEQDGQ